jgi:hypothetical protein
MAQTMRIEKMAFWIPMIELPGWKNEKPMNKVPATPNANLLAMYVGDRQFCCIARLNTIGTCEIKGTG